MPLFKANGANQKVKFESYKTKPFSVLLIRFN